MISAPGRVKIFPEAINIENLLQKVLHSVQVYFSLRNLSTSCAMLVDKIFIIVPWRKSITANTFAYFLRTSTTLRPIFNQVAASLTRINLTNFSLFRLHLTHLYTHYVIQFSWRKCGQKKNVLWTTRSYFYEQYIYNPYVANKVYVKRILADVAFQISWTTVYHCTNSICHLPLQWEYQPFRKFSVPMDLASIAKVLWNVYRDS